MNRNTFVNSKLKSGLLAWANLFDVFTMLDSNELACNPLATHFSEYELVLAVGVESELKASENPFEELRSFIANSYSFGYFSYDLKNHLEKLSSSNFDGLNFPDIHFYKPLHIVGITKSGSLHILKSSINEQDLKQEIELQVASTPNIVHTSTSPRILGRISKDCYIQTVERIKEHIRLGDIYELNYCQEFYASSCTINPLETYLTLCQISPTPFACLYKHKSHYLISASPERYILKKGNSVISQPIKGTIKRGNTDEEDNQLKNLLKNDPKERAENVMIVDLVRNDLSKIALDGSVNVTELFGIYPFKQVFQMISTVQAEVDPSTNPVDIIRATFPMGSMTGAPKVRAMQLIEEYEQTKRSLYSGSVGFFAPNGDFDFNVVIRSILYNSDNQYLSFSVGSAITIGSEPRREYDECLIKAKAIMQALNQKSC